MAEGEAGGDAEVLGGVADEGADCCEDQNSAKAVVAGAVDDGERREQRVRSGLR
ncbi:MAG TPA: hypothetical protein VI320_25370 [Terracidiphilus sp.]|jgi:hypothetical protein